MPVPGRVRGLVGGLGVVSPIEAGIGGRGLVGGASPAGGVTVAREAA